MAVPIIRARFCANLTGGRAGCSFAPLASRRGRTLTTQAAAVPAEKADPTGHGGEPAGSAGPAAGTGNPLPASFRTAVSDPRKHTAEHVGRYYTVPKAVQNGLFSIYQLSKKARELHKLSGEFSIMVRQPFIEVRSYLEQYDFTQPALRIVLYGRLGTGKSHTMAHVLHYALMSDWIIIGNHWLPEWVKRPKEIQVNEEDPLILDNPLDAVIWLQHFRLLNADLLGRLNLTTSQEWKWSETDVTARGEPLTNIVEHGIKRAKHACLCVRALLEEVKAYTNAGKMKTLVAVEGVNIIWEDSYQRRVDRSYVPSQDFHLIQSFKSILSNDWKNAAVIVTVDEGALSLKHRNLQLENVPSFMPQYLLGKKGFEFFEPFLPVRLENYTDKEFESAIDFFIATNFIQHPKAKTAAAREEFKFLSGNNPRELLKLCSWI